MTNHLNESQEKQLRQIAETLIAPKKGILAADESIATIGKYFSVIGIENNVENRRKYRQLFFMSDKSYAKFISGVILFHETIDQKNDNGIPFLNILKDNGIIPGIKVDKGIIPMLGTDGETTTQGLDDLGQQCKDYKRKGCQFAKWRSVFRINSNSPSPLAILDNVSMMAKYAAVCQQNGLVPIIEPEVLSDGNHDLKTTQRVTEHILAAVYHALIEHRVYLEGTLLKPNMVTPGRAKMNKCTPDDIAKATVATLQRTVPTAVPGIVFLSGGQTEEEASLNLNAIAKYPAKKPWTITFSFGRGLQMSALKAWGGKAGHVQRGQEEFINRAKANSLACQGLYKSAMTKCI